MYYVGTHIIQFLGYLSTLQFVNLDTYYKSDSLFMFVSKQILFGNSRFWADFEQKIRLFEAEEESS